MYSDEEGEERLAILDTIASYSYHFDSRDAHGWSQLFTEDGVWEFRPQVPAAGLPPFRQIGRAAIKAWAERRYETLGSNARFLHHQSTTRFLSISRDDAETRTLLIVTRCDVGELPRISATGTYHDIWRRTGEGWRFASRLLVT
jgi:hypothetical protein